MNKPKLQDRSLEADVMHARSLPPGHEHYRAFVGPPAQYDIMGATQFSLATSLGLQEEDRLLDVGCGSLRAGRFFIQYLLPDRYFGIEPEERLWKTAIDMEIGRDAIAIKRPRFSRSEDFRFDDSGRRYEFILAQSIFSHTGLDMFESALIVLASQLEENGQFLFTAIVEESASYSASREGVSARGWLYPGCVRYRRDDVFALGAKAGLLVEKINWRHPRQTWFRAVSSKSMLLGENCEFLGGGRILFNPRYR